MSRIAPVSDAEAPAASKPLIDAVRAKLGSVPNLVRVFGRSPAALEGYLGLSGALGNTLDAKTRERIALAVAEANGCEYCLSAHTYLATNVAKLSNDEIALARDGRSADVKANAAVRFAKKVAETHGNVADADVAAVRAAGFDDAQIVEIVGNVVLNALTNFTNNVAQTPIDFPVVRQRNAA